MKNIVKMLALAFAFVAFAGCNKDNTGVINSSAADDNKEIHFLNSKITKTFTQDVKEGVISVLVGRNGNKGMRKIVLLKTGADASLFSLKDTVVIPDGQYSVEVPVTVNMGSVVLGSEVSMTLGIVGRDVTLGTNASYISSFSDLMTVSASFELEWEPYMRLNDKGESVQQTASYHYTQFYTGGQVGMEVERAKGTTNIFRVLDWAAGVPLLFKLNADNSVVVPKQSIGYFNSEENEYVMVSDIASYLGDESYYSTFPCTFDGKQTFTLNLIYFVSQGMYGYGEETLKFEGDHDKDAAMEAEYKGDGKFAFDVNSYTSSIRLFLVEEDIMSDKTRLNGVYNTVCLGQDSKIVTIPATQTEYTFTPSVANNTLVAVPFDASGMPGEMFACRFTYDPEGNFTPKFLQAEMSADASDPYSTLKLKFKVKNASTFSVAILERSLFEYYLKGYSADFIINSVGLSLTGSDLVKANSEEGYTGYYANQEEGTEFMAMARIENKYGDVEYKTIYASTASHTVSFENKTIDDFIGAFIMTADVTTGTGSSASVAEEAYRVDIIKTGETTVSVRGLSNDYNYSPAIKGEYVASEHCIRLYPQELGYYSYMDVTFGFCSTLYTGVWSPKSALEFGFCADGLLRYRPMDGSEVPVSGYKFLLFSNGSYSGYSIANKAYNNLLMQKIK